MSAVAVLFGADLFSKLGLLQSSSVFCIRELLPRGRDFCCQPQTSSWVLQRGRESAKKRTGSLGDQWSGDRSPPLFVSASYSLSFIARCVAIFHASRKDTYPIWGHLLPGWDTFPCQPEAAESFTWMTSTMMDLATYSYTCTTKRPHYVCRFFKYFLCRSVSHLFLRFIFKQPYFCLLSDLVQTLRLTVGIGVYDIFLSNCVYRNITSACCHGISWACLVAAWRCWFTLESTLISVKLCKNTDTARVSGG